MLSDANECGDAPLIECEKRSDGVPEFSLHTPASLELSDPNPSEHPDPQPKIRSMGVSQNMDWNDFNQSHLLPQQAEGLDAEALGLFEGDSLGQ